MPVHAESRNGKWVIVEDSTGHVVGHSDSRKKAHIAAAIRNQKHREKLQREQMDLFPPEQIIQNMQWFEEQGFALEKATDLALHLAAQVTAEDRKRHATLTDGRFPIFNKATARSAIRLRGHTKSKAERLAVIRRAARYLPEMARAALEEDKAKGLV